MLMGLSLPSRPVGLLPRTMDATVGHIEIVLGPMFSGKTTELIRRIRRYKHGNRRCLLIKYKHDTRYSEEMAATHDRCFKFLKATQMLVGSRRLHDLHPDSRSCTRCFLISM